MRAVLNPHQRIAAILSQSHPLTALAAWLETQGPPDAWLAAGCVVQTVWNHFTGRPLSYGICDHDIVYFDADLNDAREAAWQQTLTHNFPTLKLDVKNQARVHLWFPQKFGVSIPPFASVSAAMRSWPTTATATAARLRQGHWELLTPLGTDDLLNLVLRPNHGLASEAVYLAKTTRWQALWPELNILPWQAKDDHNVSLPE